MIENYPSNTNHEHIELYHRIYNHTLAITNLTNLFGDDVTLNIVGQQLLKSSARISLHVLETKTAHSSKECMTLYHHALAAANETKLWLAIIRDTSSTHHVDARKILDETIQIVTILTAKLLAIKN